MRKTSSSFVQSTVALLVIGFVALFGIVGTTIWLGQRAQVYFDEVVEARDARGAAVELRNALRAAESSQRGFLLGGNQIYLAPYDTAKRLTERQAAMLRELFASYGEAAAPVERLAAIIGEQIVEMDRTIALKQSRQDAEALAVFQTNRGKALMDEANVFFAGLIRIADERLAASIEEHRSNATWLRLVSIVAGFIIVGVVVAASVTVRRYTAELGAARDEVTALNAGLEERVRERTADLARVNDEIQRFAYIVTHDLRAPLVNIMGFTSELESSAKSLRDYVEKAGFDDPAAREARTAATEDLPEAIGFIRSSTRKMDSLINAILKLSRDGRRVLRPEPVDLAEAIESSAASIRHRVQEAKGALEMTVRTPQILSDRLSLEQIFGNLFDNAVKYRARERPLRIAVNAGVVPGDRISVEISDNGRGIAEQDRERVFELFRRSGVQDEAGEGIGLAHVRTVVRNLGGDITMTSTFGEGTTFRIVLPRVLQTYGAPAA